MSTSDKVIVRARWPNLNFWCFLAKDSRKTDGSLYYWSSNMAIATALFANEAAARKTLDRLKIKTQCTGFEIVPFEPGVQVVPLKDKTT